MEHEKSSLTAEPGDGRMPIAAIDRSRATVQRRKSLHAAGLVVDHPLTRAVHGCEHLAMNDRLHPIDRALHAYASAIQDVRVDHCGTDVGVPEQLLDCPDVISGLEQVRCEGMALMPRAA
jgi:hypothetical protein